MVIFMGQKGERVVHRGKHLEGGVRLISAVKVEKLLNQRCEGFICNVLESKVLELSLKDIRII